jgi:hypothetical protein
VPCCSCHQSYKILYSISRIGITIKRVKFLTVAIAALFAGLALSSSFSLSFAQSADAQSAGLEEGSLAAAKAQASTYGCGISFLMRLMAFASKILVRVMEPVYQNIYICLDLIVTSFGYCRGLFSVLVNVWGAIESEIKIVTTLLNLCTTLCSTMPFIATVPSVLMTLCWDIPLAFCGILKNCGFLFLTLSSMQIDAISRIRDWFPAPGETL